MKAVVFGGSGFLGSHVADELTDRGYQVTIYDVEESPYLRDGQEMTIGDILDQESVEKVVSGAHVVYNFAGIADLDAATTQPMDTIRYNIMGTVIILEACRKAGIKRFVYASSIYVYSQLGGFYRCSKQAAELYIEEYQKKFGLDFTILRYGTLYGPRADERNSVYRYIRQALEKGRISCNGTGEETREYINVKVAAKLSVDILEGGFKNEHVIITGHNPMKFRDMLNTIKEILNNKVEIEYIKPTNSAHYNITPYSFTPKIGRKLVSNLYVDMGQGILESVEEIYREIGKE